MRVYDGPDHGEVVDEAIRVGNQNLRLDLNVDAHHGLLEYFLQNNKVGFERVVAVGSLAWPVSAAAVNLAPSTIRSSLTRHYPACPNSSRPLQTASAASLSPSIWINIYRSPSRETGTRYHRYVSECALTGPLVAIIIVVPMPGRKRRARYPDGLTVQPQ